jgi:hypothetical protein
MITRSTTAEAQLPPAQIEENRFEQIRIAAKERRRRSDIDGTERRARRAAEGNRLV